MAQRPEQEQDLREAFAAARRAETSSAPPFERVRRGRPPRLPSRRRWWPVAAIGVAGAMVAVVVANRRSEKPPAWLQTTVGQLRTPTDFLLDVSGAEFLRTVPSIGKTEGLFPMTGNGEGHRL